MRESKSGRRLQAPDYLGAPAPSTLSPRASRYLDSVGRRMGRESSRMVLLSLLGGVAVIGLLLFLTAVVRSLLASF